MYIGHKSEDGRWQPLREHLQGVAELAKGFAQPFLAGDHAARTGLLHDAGKYSEAGQRRMMNPENTVKVDHATYGAKIAWKQMKDAYAAAAIAGHHGGMPNLGSSASAEGDGSLRGRCMKELSGRMDAYPFWDEIRVDAGDVFPAWLKADRDSLIDQFYTRMLFSCLVDADFLDTEAFMKPGENLRGQYDAIENLLEKLCGRVSAWLEHPDNELNAKRSEILKNCLDAATRAPGLYTLTVPTGGGKTVSSLAFALKHAALHGMKRVIYVIPYTSIIEQNAGVFAEILGDRNVLEHHAGMEPDETDDQENALTRRKMLATENWDAPIIVTTAVQFFESLFSNKPSKCRKLHNIAGSVMIFDEAQMLPLSYLKPCVWAISELVRHYHATAVLCTATQPSLKQFFSEYAPTLDIREICRDVPALQAFFRRVRFRDMGTMEQERLADALSKQRQVLCIVNTRKNAQALFQKLPGGGSFHLSTRMTPDHRARKLQEIRERLKSGLPCRVVSTSLLEAGVDVDFPQVWREKAGLDSILQAAGRCNREGKRPAAESEVLLFSLPDTVPRGIRPNKAAAEIALESAGNPDESPVIQSYFHQLYRMNGEKALDSHGILDMCRKIEFEEIARHFHLIESQTCTVYIPSAKNAEDLERLRAGRYSRALMRRLGRSAVGVYPWDWEKMRKDGKLECLDERSAILLDTASYDDQCGLKTDGETGIGLFE